jgi:large subunit ribosomal protein L21
MYAVIKTGGKQYRVKPGDVLVVEKLAGEPGDKVAFDQVLMLGEGEAITLGAPLVADAEVSATFIETRKGEKVKVFKKIRRQGYRRTRGHRQFESVVRVTAITGAGMAETWDGEVDLTPLAVLNLRARNLAPRAAAELPADIEVETVVEPKGRGKSPRVTAKVVEHADPVADDAAAEAVETKAVATPKAKAKGKTAGAKTAGAPKTAQSKAPGSKEARAAAPKPSKAQTKSPVRRSAPRGGKG